jgi:hypothetical protein
MLGADWQAAWRLATGSGQAVLLSCQRIFCSTHALRYGAPPQFVLIFQRVSGYEAVWSIARINPVAGLLSRLSTTIEIRADRSCRASSAAIRARDTCPVESRARKVPLIDGHLRRPKSSLVPS